MQDGDVKATLSSSIEIENYWFKPKTKLKDGLIPSLNGTKNTINKKLKIYYKNFLIFKI